MVSGPSTGLSTTQRCASGPCSIACSTPWNVWPQPSTRTPCTASTGLKPTATAVQPGRCTAACSMEPTYVADRPQLMPITTTGSAAPTPCAASHAARSVTPASGRSSTDSWGSSSAASEPASR
jgi:hypothetical protein